MPSFFKDHLTAGWCVVPFSKKNIWVSIFSKHLPGTGIMYHAFHFLRSPTLCHIFRVPAGVRHPTFVVIRQRVRAPRRSPCIIIRQRVREPGACSEFWGVASRVPSLQATLPPSPQIFSVISDTSCHTPTCFSKILTVSPLPK